MKLIDTGAATAARNMSIDQELLDSLQTSTEPILHLYEWQRFAATYGHFANPHLLFDTKRGEELGYDVAKRPTGGGVIFHTSDFAFSFLLPASHPLFSENTLDNYNLVNTQVGEVLKRYSNGALIPTLQPCPKSQDRPSFCMVRPTCFDLVIEGKKAAGAAQRKTKHGFLHQGSISLTLPIHIEQLVDPCVAEQMRASSYFLLGSQATELALQQARNQLHGIIIEVFQNNKQLHQ